MVGERRYPAGRAVNALVPFSAIGPETATATRWRPADLPDEAAGLDLVLLHNGLSPSHQRDVIESLRAGRVRAVGVVGMLGGGFDLPSLRLVACHDKHRSLPATI
jgi:hypothetical protein